MISTSKVSDTEIFEKTVNLPVINANTDCSPCQALSALLTIFEICHSFTGLKVTLAGNFKVDDNSLLYGLIKLGADVTLLTTENGEPEEEIIVNRSLHVVLIECTQIGNQKPAHARQNHRCYQYKQNIQQRIDSFPSICP